MKHCLLFAAAIPLLAIAAGATWHAGHGRHPQTNTATLGSRSTVVQALELVRLATMARAARQYSASNHLNSKFCFLVDMQLPAGRQRFFIYNLQRNCIQAAGMVTHGACNQRWLSGRKFGNEIGCGCTSLGRYKIGSSYQGRFGLAYKLHGLDDTNSNAYPRFVVLHSMQCVPEKEVDPLPICQSDGCPSVSPRFLKELAPIINSSRQPILLWIFD